MLMIGLPYSGKTTYLFGRGRPGEPVVSPDAIRLALHGQRYAQVAESVVWSMVDVLTRSLFLAGHDVVIVDACHNTEKRRHAWIPILAKLPWPVQIHYTVFLTPGDVCIARAVQAGDQHIIPVIGRMVDQHEEVPGFPYEDFEGGGWDAPHPFIPVLDNPGNRSGESSPAWS